MCRNMKTVGWQLLKGATDAALLKSLKDKITLLQTERVANYNKLTEYKTVLAKAQTMVTDYTAKISKIDSLMQSALKEIEILSPKSEQVKTEMATDTMDKITNVPKKWADLYIK